MNNLSIFILVVLIPIAMFFGYFGYESLQKSDGFFTVVPNEVADAIESLGEQSEFEKELESLDNREVFEFIEQSVREEKERREQDETISETARYKVEIITEWSAEKHGEEYFPDNAHFSAPVVWTSRNSRALYAPGIKASAGIEEMAETGKTNILEQELLAIGPSGGLYHYQIGSRVESTDRQEFELRSSRNSSVLHLVTMIAPSPDWFLASGNISLFDGESWTESFEAELVALDAGTESGSEFSISNPESDGVIGELVDIPSSELPTFAKIRVTRIRAE